MMWIMKRKRSSRGSLLTPKKKAKGVSNMFRKRSSTKQKEKKVSTQWDLNPQSLAP